MTSDETRAEPETPNSASTPVRKPVVRKPADPREPAARRPVAAPRTPITPRAPQGAAGPHAASVAQSAMVRTQARAAAGAAARKPGAARSTAAKTAASTAAARRKSTAAAAERRASEPASADAARLAHAASLSVDQVVTTTVHVPVPVLVDTSSLPDPVESAAGPAIVARSAGFPAGNPAAEHTPAPVVLNVSGLRKRFGHTTAVSGIDLTVRAGSFYGIVGPNGAGKTTTLSMITGLLRPDAGSVYVHGINVWDKPRAAKRVIGVLPDRLRLFDRLTGAQLLSYAGTLRGLDHATVRSRSADLSAAFGLDDALHRLVADYSVGMTKKIALACAMIHAPRLLVLDEPFESVDPVSAVKVTEILQTYVANGGTVVMSSHGMDLIQRVCDHVAIIVNGTVLASGTIDEVRAEKTLEDRFVELAGGRTVTEGMEWLHSFSD